MSLDFRDKSRYSLVNRDFPTYICLSIGEESRMRLHPLQPDLRQRVTERGPPLFLLLDGNCIGAHKMALNPYLLCPAWHDMW